MEELHGPEPRTADEYLIQIYAAVRALVTSSNNLGRRVERLERWRWYLEGLGAASAIMAAALVGHLVHLLG